MQSTGAPCVKLLAREVAHAQFRGSVSGRPSFASGTTVFDRVWVQGTVHARGENSLKLTDSSGSLDVLVSSTLPGVDLAAIVLGDYCLVVGPLVEASAAGRHIRAHKVINLTAELADVAQRTQQWEVEVAELRAQAAR